MKTGVLGTGMVGRTIGAKLGALGHDIMIGTRDPATTMARTGSDGTSFGAWLERHAGLRLGSYSDAAAHGELVVNATRGRGSVDTLEAAGAENLSGKVILDIANPLDFSKGMPPRSRSATPTRSASRSGGDSRTPKCAHLSFNSASADNTDTL